MKHSPLPAGTWTVLLLSLAAFVGGCARLDYVKVPTPTQYANWTDEDQRRADAMKGVRYYLPRPFLHLKQSTPVSQRVAFVSLSINEDKTAYNVRFPPDAPTWLRRALPEEISSRQVLMAAVGRRAPDDEADLQSGEEEPPDDAAPRPRDTPPPSEITARTGFISDTDPVTRLGARMDVVYLPDFEEQYVIQPHAGLGKADIETRLRNGWAAEVFSQQVTNENLVPYVIRQVEQTSEAAAGIVTTWAPLAMGLPPGTAPTPKDLRDALDLQAGEEITGETVERLLGAVVLMKVAEVRIAQPGLYPILKPREMTHWLGGGPIVSVGDPEANLEAYLEQANLPWIRPDMAFIPAPPFTMIGFHTTTDIFITTATQRIGVEDARPDREAQRNAAAPDPSDLMHALNTILLDEGPFAAEVVESAEGLVISIVVPGEPPPTFTRQQQEELGSSVIKFLEAQRIAEHVARLELPASEDTIRRFEHAVNEALAGWRVSIAIEGNRRHLATLTRTNEAADMTTSRREAEEAIRNAWADWDRLRGRELVFVQPDEDG